MLAARSSQKAFNELPQAFQPSIHTLSKKRTWKQRLAIATLCAITWYTVNRLYVHRLHRIIKHGPQSDGDLGWGSFPKKDDPFHFLPCTDATAPPSLDEPHPLEVWQRLYEPDTERWRRGKEDKRALYLCGWLDVPLDYTNSSDKRIARLAVTRFQRSPVKSERTMVNQPGGPGGPGAAAVLEDGETLSRDYSDNTLDVLGWDPRGVGLSLPAISCFPYDADRDRYKLLTNRAYREGDPRKAMLTTDAMNEAVLRACHEKYGDVTGMITTAFVARDLEEIRKAMNESKLSGYFVSYGSEVGQTYVNMFPDSVGRLVLDGVVYARTSRELSGFSLGSQDNVTDTFEDGFVGECIDAGPERCKLAQPLEQGGPLPSRQDLIETIRGLFDRALDRPFVGYTEDSGPVIITYSDILNLISMSLYDPHSWDQVAAAIFDLLQGDPALMSRLVAFWDFDPSSPAVPSIMRAPWDLAMLVICTSQYHADLPADYDARNNGEKWYLDLWKHMEEQTEIGSRAFLWTLPCRHYKATCAAPKEVYLGDLNHTLSNPLLLVSGTYDPATPLSGGLRLKKEMGDNAKLVVHHGYGHLSGDTSTCTNNLIRAYLLSGTLPEHDETHCYADEKPYRYTQTTVSR